MQLSTEKHKLKPAENKAVTAHAYNLVCPYLTLNIPVKGETKYITV
jgi:hypothetical protein